MDDVLAALKAAVRHYRLELQRESYVKVGADGCEAIIVGVHRDANYILERRRGGPWTADSLMRSSRVVDAAEEHCYATGDVFTVIPPLSFEEIDNDD